MDVRESLIAAALSRAPTVVRFESQGKPSIVVGRVALVDAKCATVVYNRSQENTAYRVWIDDIDSVEPASLTSEHGKPDDRGPSGEGTGAAAAGDGQT